MTKGFDFSQSQEPADPAERGRIVERLKSGERVELPDWGVMHSSGLDYEQKMVGRFLLWAEASLAIEKRSPEVRGLGAMEPMTREQELENDRRVLEDQRRVVMTISSGTYADRCALAQLLSQLLDNFGIENEKSKDLIPYSELEMLDEGTSVKICVETE